MAKSVEDRVRMLIVDEIGADPGQVKPNARLLEDLGADSLDSVEMMMVFEEEFGITIPEEDAAGLKTVGDIVAYVKDRAGL